MSQAGPRVLVTGAGGFVGSHLAEHLLAAGWAVRAFVYDDGAGGIGLLHHLPSEALAALDIVRGDLIDAGTVDRAAAGVDVIVHLAAQSSVPYSIEHPRAVFGANVLATLNLLEATRAHGAGRLVYASTGAVYGTARYLPIDEAHPLHAGSPYAASKIGAEALVSSYHASYGLPTVILRPFNIYGPRQSTQAVIPAIIQQALTADAVHMGAPDPTRDFTHVADVVDAYRRAATVEAAVGGVFNLGTGTDIAMGDLARTIIRLAGRDVPLVTGEADRLRPAGSDAQRVCASADRAREALGWTPQIVLEDGLRRTLDFYAGQLGTA